MADQPNSKRNGPIVAIIVVIILILAGLGVYSHHRQKTESQPLAPASGTAAPQNTAPTNQTLLPTPKAISPFTLTNDEGKPLTNDNLKGQWSLVFFGFTGCGDVCPTTLSELNKMYLQLEKDLPAQQLPQIIFISVDPERDTTEVLHRYIKNYNPHFTAATGSADNLNVFVKDLGLYFSKKPRTNPNDYGMDHSSQIYLFNPDGQWVGIDTYPQSAQELVNNYKNLIHAQPH